MKLFQQVHIHHEQDNFEENNTSRDEIYHEHQSLNKQVIYNTYRPFTGLDYG